MPKSRSALWLGVRDVSPILVGVVPFGLIYGIVATSVGVPKVGAILMSSLVFAGASQIAALELMGVGAPIAIIILTALVINLRFLMYSVSITPYLGRSSLGWKWVYSYLLTDQAYAVSIVRFQNAGDDFPRRSYYLGSAIALWVTWQASSAAGVLLGATIPASWGLEFAIPLTFLALLVPAIESRPSLAAAITAGAVAIPASALPMHTGLLVAAAAGIAMGGWLEGRRR